MVHLLEHLPGFDIAHRFLAKSCAVAEDFVFIRQPYFDSDVPLFRLGLKCYWSDWSGHRFTMTSFDMFRIVSRLHRQGECAAFTIGFKEPVTDSSHRYIHSVDSPIDQHEYDGDIHPEKAMDVEFDFPVFKELITVIGMSIDAHAAACKKVYWGTKEVVVEGPA
jgi:hypothetical protein